jgi:hypothetical protein
MADISKPEAKPEKSEVWSAPEEEYELVPYKEIAELKDELHRLKDYPIPSSKKLQVSMDELALKIDRMTQIMEEAGHEMHAEEGGLSLEDKLGPIMERLEKVLEQNSEIAKGIVAVADLIEELRQRLEKGFMVKESMQMPEPMQQGAVTAQPYGGPTPSQELPPLPGAMPPPPPKKGFF